VIVIATSTTSDGTVVGESMVVGGEHDVAVYFLRSVVFLRCGVYDDEKCVDLGWIATTTLRRNSMCKIPSRFISLPRKQLIIIMDDVVCGNRGVVGRST